jgi:pimeloyl-ACP methyl ester carboxylesterase
VSRSRPETRYARLGAQRIAYQVLGDGPLDVVFCTGVASSVDQNWNDPDTVEMLRRTAGYARLIMFDPRGTGASDPQPGDILASSTVKDLVVGSGMTFADRGTRRLKGIPDEWRLYAVEGV